MCDWFKVVGDVEWVLLWLLLGWGGLCDFKVLLVIFVEGEVLVVWLIGDLLV